MMRSNKQTLDIMHTSESLVPHVSILGLLLVPGMVSGAETGAQAASGSGIDTSLLITMILAFSISGLIIVGLVGWGRKQDTISHMVDFCMKLSLQSGDEASRYASAMALSKVNDIGALLVLVGIFGDDKEEELVRLVAGEALSEIKISNRKHREIFSILKSAVEQRDHKKVTELLIDNFERQDKKYVQSAYMIGRQFMKLDQYFEAREWLRTAEIRNIHFNLYGDRIRKYIEVCDELLLLEADTCFKDADYLQAKERYAALSHDLEETARKRFALYLRMGCTYCKLGDYTDAHEAILQALTHGHETEISFKLNDLLKKRLGHADHPPEVFEDNTTLEATMDQLTTDIMKKLHFSSHTDINSEAKLAEKKGLVGQAA